MAKQIGQVLKQMMKISPLELESVFYSYILTPDEANTVIQHALEAEIKSAVLTMQKLHYLPQQIERKLSEIDFKSKLDEFDLLDKANVRKHWYQQQVKELEEIRENDKNIKAKIKKQCDAKYFFTLMANSFKIENRAFVQDEFSIPYIKTLCFFMGDADRFENELGHDKNKGLWIIGKPGIGKTRLIEAISDNSLEPIKIVSTLTIADAVQSDGSYEIGEFDKILFDDVGSEQPVVNHFGTKINWLKDFIELYYARRRLFSKLIVTTNCGFSEIEEKYGYRFRSRVREMFNIIHLKGEDRRK